MPLKELLETIQTNLTNNIDSIYKDAIDGIYTNDNEIKWEKDRTLGWKKRVFKEQIENYLKVVVKNIQHKILYQEFNDYIKEINEAIKD